MCLHVTAFDVHQSVRIKSNNIIYILDINIISIVMSMLSRQACLTLCDPMDCSPPGSSVHGILQAGILEKVAMVSSGGCSPPKAWTQVPHLLYWQAGSSPPAVWLYLYYNNSISTYYCNRINMYHFPIMPVL